MPVRCTGQRSTVLALAVTGRTDREPRVVLHHRRHFAQCGRDVPVDSDGTVSAVHCTANVCETEQEGPSVPLRSNSRLDPPPSPPPLSLVRISPVLASDCIRASTVLSDSVQRCI